MKKRILSLFLVLSMLLSLFPAALAEESGVTEIAVHETVEDEAAVEMGIPALFDIVPEASNDFVEQSDTEIIEPGTEDSGNTINSVVPEEMEANADESVPSEQDEEIEQSENSMEGESTEPSSLEQWETAESDESLTIPSSQESQDTFDTDDDTRTSQEENVESFGEDENDRKSQSPIATITELDALSVEGTTDFSENDSSGNTNHIIESEENCDAEFVHVVFICDPDDTQITVYDPTKLDENDEPTVIVPEGSDTHSYLLLPGTYLYDAVCEGYEPVEKVEFEVDALEGSKIWDAIYDAELEINIYLTQLISPVLYTVSQEQLPPIDSEFAIVRKFITAPSEVRGMDYTNNANLAVKLDSIFNGNVEFYTSQGDGTPNEKYLAVAPLGDTETVKTKKYIYIKNVGKWASGYTCFIYASAVYNLLFGDSPLSPVSGADSHSVEIINNTQKLSGKELYEQFKLAGVQTGAFMQTSNNEGSHSMILLSFNEDSITYLAANDDGDGLVRIGTKDWDTFNNFTRNRYLRRVYQPPQDWYDACINNGVSSDAYILSFDSNGGTGYMSSFTVEYGNAFTLPANTFTKTGYEFKGWNVQRDVDGAYYVRSENTWMTQSQIDKGGYSKEVYPDQATKTFNDSWTDCVEGKSSYTFIAIWKEGAEKPLSTLAITEEVYPSGHYDTMNSFGLRGKIASNYTITEVEAHIYDSSGKDALPAYNKTWNKTIYNIQSDGINNSFSFGKLDNGEYRYVVFAADESGEKRKLIDSDFSIGETIPVHEHRYTEVTVEKAPTPESAGMRRFSCSCGESYTQTIESFTPAVIPEGVYTVQSKRSGTWLTAPSRDSSELYIKAANRPDESQLWQFSRHDDGSYEIKNAQRDMAIDVVGGSAERGALIQVYSSNNTNAQRWFVVDRGDGCYELVSKASYYVLDVCGGDTDDGTLVQQYEPNSTAAQRWQLTVYQFSMGFDANGGTGHMDSFTVNYGQDFTLSENSFIRPGYDFLGWNVKRSGDNTWHVWHRGWLTDDQIAEEGQRKDLYEDKETRTFNNSWLDGLDGDTEFTFYAVWKEILPGDVNFDGLVNADDALLILRYVEGLSSVFNTADEATETNRFLAADVNADGAVDGADALELQRYAIGLRTAF